MTLTSPFRHVRAPHPRFLSDDDYIARDQLGKSNDLKMDERPARAQHGLDESLLLSLIINDSYNDIDLCV